MPPGYEWNGRSTSASSNTTALETEIGQRDVFQGQRRCVICGEGNRAVLQHCSLITPEQSYEVWEDLKDRGWIPQQAKTLQTHDPRSAILLCNTHHQMYDTYQFFIRYVPELRKCIFINHSDEPSQVQHHGKAISLNVDHRYAPFTPLFLMHEICVRAYNPFQPTMHVLPEDPAWQDWLLSDGVLDDAVLSRSAPLPHDSQARNAFAVQQPQVQPADIVQEGVASDSGDCRTIDQPDASVIDEILAATRSSPSWKACVIEGTRWDGTSEENAQRYISLVGVEDPAP